MTERDRILSRVAKLMNWESEKALLWYETENPFFGNCSPKFMVDTGRGHKVRSFIDNAEEENSWGKEE
jgi:hypothetical protein